MVFLSLLVVTPTMILRTRGRHQARWQLMFCAWSLLLIAGYTAGHAQIFDWYIPLYTIPIFVASSLCYGSVGYPQKTILKGLLYLLFLVALTSLGRTFYASISNPGKFSGFAGGARVRSYLYVGAVLYQTYPDATLLTSEIGGLGYAFRGKILDAAGLASPDSLEFHPMQFPEERPNGAVGAIPPEYVKKHLPELIVSYDYFAQALLRDDVIQQYNLVKVPALLPEDAVWSESKTVANRAYLRIYVRKDLPLPPRLTHMGE